jgi:hypothetical protein
VVNYWGCSNYWLLEKKPDNFSQLWKFAPKNVRKVITASWRVFYTTKTLTESGGKGGQNRFESAWVRHFGDSPRKIRPIYEVLAAARRCTQQSVHEYARYECRTPRGARGGVQARPTARFVPFCPVSHKKRSLKAKTYGTFLTKNLGLNFIRCVFKPTILSQSQLLEFAKKTRGKRRYIGTLHLKMVHAEAP